MVACNPELYESSIDLQSRASDEALSLFAFTTGAHEMRLPDGAQEVRLALHRVGSVTALIGIVPLADYSGAEAESRFADIGWLAPRVRRHAELVEWAMQSSSVFPAPFGTLYTSLDSLSAFMRAHEATIAGFLQTVAGKEEWELRAGARFDSPEILDQLACNAWPDLRKLPKGARYMRLCRDRDALLDFGREDAARLVRDLLAELESLTAAVRQLGAGAEASGSDLIARYALLVAKKDVAALQDHVLEVGNRSTHRHLAIALSGPWPPFSFRPDLNAPN